MRQLMLRLVRAHLGGEDPPGLDPTIPYDRINSAAFVTPRDTSWKETSPLVPALAGSL